MNDNILKTLAEIILPAEILKYFDIQGIEQDCEKIVIKLDEKFNTEICKQPQIESNGFAQAHSITDFPIRDHKLILQIRRIRYLNKVENKTFSLPIPLEIKAKGTQYSKEFGAFLKDEDGDKSYYLYFA